MPASPPSHVRPSTDRTDRSADRALDRSPDRTGARTRAEQRDLTRVAEAHLELLHHALTDLDAGRSVRLFGRWVRNRRQAREAYLDRLACVGVPGELGEDLLSGAAL